MTSNISNTTVLTSFNVSENIFVRYPGGLLLKQFLPNVFYLKLYALPIWFVVGLIGNAISFLIWVSSRQRGKNSSAVYLAALALSDLFLCLAFRWLSSTLPFLHLAYFNKRTLPAFPRCISLSSILLNRLDIRIYFGTLDRHLLSFQTT